MPHHDTHQYLIALCTCPDQDTAAQLADRLVGDRLAACVNIVPGITSVYHWRDGIEHDNELLLLIKTRRELFPALEATIRQHHPYELPEVIAVSIEEASQAYLDWIDQSLGKKNVT
ncbi:MAG: divalent-cation tolerance protein CutA [Gammaproteobacteria bacterium]|nr:divalent-cation tolerance protein CutA [Gammaproteobacteria bacterium]MDH5651878.1 divalent-cation tolerance protein CutA [Gammaproteobacteria bacterium]